MSTKKITVFLKPTQRVFNVLRPIKRFISENLLRKEPFSSLHWFSCFILLGFGLFYTLLELHESRPAWPECCCLKGYGVNVAGTHGCLHRVWRGGVNDVRSTAAHRRDAVLCYFLCLPDLKRFTVCWAWVPVCYQLFCWVNIIFIIIYLVELYYGILSHTCLPVKVVYHLIFYFF